MLSAKLKNITPSFTIGISTKVKELQSEDHDIINLSIGEPDFSTPEVAKEGAYEAIQSNLTKYDGASGLLDLRKAIVEKLKRENNLCYTPEEIVVSSGAKHGITNTLIALLDPGDEVLIPKPYWVSYPEMIKLTGGIPVFVDTQESNSFKVTPEDIEKKITPQTKLIIITNPSNPTGAVYTKYELWPLVELCIKHQIYILSDEIYEKICYLEAFTSTASLSEAAKDITITVNGLSKSAAMTGWRIGYTATNKDLSKAISTVQGHLISHPSTISQWASVAALKDATPEIEAMVSIYKNRRDIAIALLLEIEDIHFVHPEGAFYVFIDVSALTHKLSWSNSFSVAFADKLLEEGKVAVVPGMAFGMDQYIRISYACDTEVLIEGIHRLKNFINKL